MLGEGLGTTRTDSSPERKVVQKELEILLEDLFHRKRGEHRDCGDIWDRDRHGVTVFQGA